MKFLLSFALFSLASAWEPQEGCITGYNGGGCMAGSYPVHAYDQGCSLSHPQCSGAPGGWDSMGECCTPGAGGPPPIAEGCECATDDDCDGDFSYCGAADGTFMVGRPPCTCYLCIRDRYPTGADTGCPANAPICTGPGVGVIPDCVGGVMCVSGDEPCYNTQEDAQKDFGCSGASPICVDQFGLEPAPGMPGAGCAACINSKNQNKKPWKADLGCGATPENPHDEGKSQPANICVTSDFKNPGWKKAGDACVPCINNEDNPFEYDYGCYGESEGGADFTACALSDDGPSVDDTEEPEPGMPGFYCHCV